jgi:hypothetical protein
MSRLPSAALDLLVLAGLIAGFFLLLDWALK